MTVQKGTIARQITGTGDIRAEARVEVFPKVEGPIQALLVEEGDRVTAGQVMARIADAEFQARVARAVAEREALQAQWAEMQAGAVPEEIAQAENQVQHSQAEMANAEGVLERAKAMVARGLQPTQELENATRRVTQAQAMYNTAQKRLQLLRTGARTEERQALQARLRAAEAAQRLAMTELQNTVVTAPMEGIVSHRYVDPGAYMTTTKMPIVTLVAMETLKVRVPISERDIGQIRPGLKTRLQVDAYPDETFTGSVRRLSPTIDPASRSGEVEISLANADLRLKPGMFAKVTLILDQRQDVVVIPRDALVQGKNGRAVFVVRDGVAHLQPVTTGLESDTMVEIRTGLEPATEIVLSGQHNLKDKAAIQVVEAIQAKEQS
jgi:multidrug efflux pump subunit AcrA (membrane-fusion protein)